MTLFWFPVKVFFSCLPEESQTSVSAGRVSVSLKKTPLQRSPYNQRGPQVRSPQHVFAFTTATCHSRTASLLHNKTAVFHHLPKIEGCRRVFLLSWPQYCKMRQIWSQRMDTRLYPIPHNVLLSSWPLTRFHSSLFSIPSLCLFKSVKD